MRTHLSWLIATLFILTNYLPVLSTMPAAQAQTASTTRFGQNMISSGDDAFVDLFQAAAPWKNLDGTATNPLSATGMPTTVPANSGSWGSGPPSVGTHVYFEEYENGLYNFYGEGNFTMGFVGTYGFQVYGGTPPPNTFSTNYIVPGSYSRTQINGTTVTRFQLLANMTTPVGTDQIGYNGGGPNYILYIYLNNIDPSNPPNNFHLVQANGIAGQVSSYKGLDGQGNWLPNNNQDFTTQYLSTFAPYCAMRFLGWENGANVWSQANTIDWSVEKPPSYWGYGHSVYMAVELCNITGCDMWYCIPFGATSTWDNGFANLIKNGDQGYGPLNPALHCYYEVADELWNWAPPYYTATNQVNQIDIALGLNEGGGIAYVLMPHLFNIQAVLGSQGRPILAAQQAVPWSCSTGLSWISRTYGPPANYIWGIAGAPYINLSNTDPVPTDMPSTFKSMNDYFNSILLPTIQNPYGNDSNPGYAGLAQHYNVHYCVYECGPGVMPTDTNSFALYTQANLDPGMGTLMQTLANSLIQNNADLVMIEMHLSAWTQNGYWGDAPGMSWVDPKSTNYNPPIKYTTWANIAAACNCGNAKTEEYQPGSSTPTYPFGSPGNPIIPGFFGPGTIPTSNGGTSGSSGSSSNSGGGGSTMFRGSHSDQ